MTCLAYQFVLLQRCNVSHMRLFSCFLALPSATVSVCAAAVKGLAAALCYAWPEHPSDPLPLRHGSFCEQAGVLLHNTLHDTCMCNCLQVRWMVRRPMVVDDSTNDDMDYDELELIEGAAAGAVAPSAAGGTTTAPEAGPAADKRKSVRMAADGEDTNISPACCCIHCCLGPCCNASPMPTVCSTWVGMLPTLSVCLYLQKMKMARPQPRARMAREATQSSEARLLQAASAKRRNLAALLHWGSRFTKRSLVGWTLSEWRTAQKIAVHGWCRRTAWTVQLQYTTAAPACRFKRNGKKLSPSSRVIWHFMVSTGINTSMLSSSLLWVVCSMH